MAFAQSVSIDDLVTVRCCRRRRCLRGGHRSGQATRERHGAEFYEAIGQKGGQVVKEKYGPNFYEQIGHKGGQKVKQLIAEAKKSARRDGES